jgi:hypothetical protein
MDNSEWAVYVFFYKIVRVKEINEAIMDYTVEARGAIKFDIKNVSWNF